MVARLQQMGGANKRITKRSQLLPSSRRLARRSLYGFAASRLDSRTRLPPTRVLAGSRPVGRGTRLHLGVDRFIPFVFAESDFAAQRDGAKESIGPPAQTSRASQDDKVMLDHTTLSSVAGQMMNGTQVTVGGRTSRVSRTAAQRLRTVRFLMGGMEYQAIEQNREKPSRWGKLAREGHQVVQVRDLASQKYVAAGVDGKVIEYSR